MIRDVGCPTCGFLTGWRATRAQVGRGGRTRVAGRRGQSLRVYWPVKRECHPWRLGGHSFAVCPDVWHDRSEPEPRPNETMSLNPDRVKAPQRRKGRARRHRVAQGKDRR